MCRCQWKKTEPYLYTHIESNAHILDSAGTLTLRSIHAYSLYYDINLYRVWYIFSLYSTLFVMWSPVIMRLKRISARKRRTMKHSKSISNVYRSTLNQRINTLCLLPFLCFAFSYLFFHEFCFCCFFRSPCSFVYNIHILFQFLYHRGCQCSIFHNFIN